MVNLEALEKRIKEQFDDLRRATSPGPDTCWLDGERCPYGLPNGRFDQRPEQFCVVPSNKSGGCNKLRPFEEVFNDMIIEGIKAEKRSNIEEEIEKEKVTLDSELRGIADASKEMENELSEEETKILLLAADIIEKNERQNNPEYRDYIVRVRDIL